MTKKSWGSSSLRAYAAEDLADYDGTLFLQHVRRSLSSTEGSLSTKVPGDLFVSFVLPYRIETKLSRTTAVYSLRADRPLRTSRYDAILEINHWCHEATYTSTDPRTALLTWFYGSGRCGEESALRSQP